MTTRDGDNRYVNVWDRITLWLLGTMVALTVLLVGILAVDKYLL